MKPIILTLMILLQNCILQPVEKIEKDQLKNQFCNDYNCYKFTTSKIIDNNGEYDYKIYNRSYINGYEQGTLYVPDWVFSEVFYMLEQDKLILVVNGTFLTYTKQ